MFVISKADGLPVSIEMSIVRNDYSQASYVPNSSGCVPVVRTEIKRLMGQGKKTRTISRIAFAVEPYSSS